MASVQAYAGAVTATGWSLSGAATGAADSIGATKALAGMGDTASITFKTFGFSIPSNYRITGLVAQVVAQVTVSDNTDISSFTLTTGGVATGSTLSTSYATYTAGSSSSTLGNVLTSAIVNDANFGFTVLITNVSGTPDTADVDAGYLTIYYGLGGGFRTRERAMGRAR